MEPPREVPGLLFSAVLMMPIACVLALVPASPGARLMYCTLSRVQRVRWLEWYVALSRAHFSVASSPNGVLPSFVLFSVPKGLERMPSLSLFSAPREA